MALHLVEGWDTYSAIGDAETSNGWLRGGVIGATTLGVGTGRFGGNCLTLVQGNVASVSWVQMNSNRVSATTGQGLDTTRYTIIAEWFNVNSKPSSSWLNSLGFGNLSGASGAPGFATTGTLTADSLAVNTFNVCDGQWHWLEYLTQHNSSAGDLQKIVFDGQVIVNTTHNNGVTSNNYGLGFQSANSGACTLKIDDIIYYDNFTSGITGDLIASSFPIGPKKVTQIRPTSAGTLTGWTPSASTNVSNVDDTSAPDNDTTYNSTSGSTIRDSFVCGDISTGDTAPLVAYVRVCAKNNAAGAGSSLVGLTDSSGNVGLSEAATLTNAYRTLSYPIFRDPATSAAWTTSGINSAEFGYGTV